MADSPFETSLRVLSLRDHSEVELRRKLRAKGHPASEIDGTVVRLKELGYLDDLRFARRFAESALAGGRYFGQRLEQELRRRGVAGETVASVLAELSAEFAEAESISRVMGRRFAGFDPASATDKEKRRVVGYLQRKGFSLAAIFKEININSTF